MAHARTTDRATSQRAAASIPDDSDCIERVKRCVIGAREFVQSAIVGMMNTLPIGLRTNGARWSEQRVRGCIADLEKIGFVKVVDNTGKYAVYRYDPKWDLKPGEPEPEPVEKRTQASMFDT